MEHVGGPVVGECTGGTEWRSRAAVQGGRDGLLTDAKLQREGGYLVIQHCEQSALALRLLKEGPGVLFVGESRSRKGYRFRGGLWNK